MLTALLINYLISAQIPTQTHSHLKAYVDGSSVCLWPLERHSTHRWCLWSLITHIHHLCSCHRHCDHSQCLSGLSEWLITHSLALSPDASLRRRLDPLVWTHVCASYKFIRTRTWHVACVCSALSRYLFSLFSGASFFLVSRSLVCVARLPLSRSACHASCLSSLVSSRASAPVLALHLSSLSRLASIAGQPVFSGVASAYNNVEYQLPITYTSISASAA